MVSDCYPPRLGGIEVQVAGLSDHLRQRGLDVGVLTATAGPEEPGVARLTPPVPLPVPINPWAGPDFRALLPRADVAHIHLGILAPFATQAARLALSAGIPTVITWHSILGGVAGAALRRTGGWRRWIEAGAIPTAVGEHLAEQLAAVVGADAAAGIQVLPNGVDPDLWRSPGGEGGRGQGSRGEDASGEGRADDGPIRIVCANRFARRRRPLAVVDVVRRIRDRLREQVGSPVAVELEVAGDGPLLAPVRQYVRSEGLAEWVELPGRLPRQELARRYHRAHLYLTPSRTESFGIAALEARTAGLPVAGLYDGGLRDFVTDEVTGILGRDDEDLIARTARLLADRARLAAMARRLRTTLPDQAWPAVVDSTIGIYQQAIEGHAR